MRDAGPSGHSLKQAPVPSLRQSAPHKIEKSGMNIVLWAGSANLINISSGHKSYTLFLAVWIGIGSANPSYQTQWLLMV
jgi:hypothetical protein